MATPLAVRIDAAFPDFSPRASRSLAPVRMAVLTILLVALGAGNVFAAHPAKQFVEGEVLVTFKASANLDAAKQTLGRHALKFETHFAGLSARRGRHTGLVREKTRTTAQLIADLKVDAAVESAEPNYLRWTTAQPNDARFAEMWAL